MCVYESMLISEQNVYSTMYSQAGPLIPTNTYEIKVETILINLYLIPWLILFVIYVCDFTERKFANFEMYMVQ